MRMSQREKRLIVLGVLVVCAYVGDVYLFEPVIASQAEVREKIQEGKNALARYERLPDSKERYQHKVDVLQHRLHRAEEGLLQGETAPLVAAEVQGMLHRFGEETGLTIVRENVPRPKPTKGLVAIPVDLSLKGKLQGVRDFLYRVQTADRLLTVSKLVIRSNRTQDRMLSVDLQITGHMQGEEKG